MLRFFLEHVNLEPRNREIRDGELFDYKWLYVCDSNKVTHFSDVNGPESNVAAR